MGQGVWHDSSDDVSSVMSDMPADSGVISSGVASPSAGETNELRSKLNLLEEIKNKLSFELTQANKVQIAR